MQLLVIRIFNSEMQRPSAVKEWQIPALAAEPMLPFSPRRVEPEEEQDTSYLAASDNMVSFSMRFIINTPDIMGRISIVMKFLRIFVRRKYSIKHLFVVCKGERYDIWGIPGKIAL